MTEAAEWGDAYSPDDWVFCHEDGSPIEPNGILSRFRRRVNSAGLRAIPFRGLRHTHATLMLASGIPGHVVSRRLGYASEAFTLSQYAHVLPQQGSEVAAKVVALVDGMMCPGRVLRARTGGLPSGLKGTKSLVVTVRPS